MIRDEEVAVIFLKEFWPRIVGDQLAKSTAPLRFRKAHSGDRRRPAADGSESAPGDGSALDVQGQ